MKENIKQAAHVVSPVKNQRIRKPDKEWTVNYNKDWLKENDLEINYDYKTGDVGLIQFRKTKLNAFGKKINCKKLFIKGCKKPYFKYFKADTNNNGFVPVEWIEYLALDIIYSDTVIER